MLQESLENFQLIGAPADATADFPLPSFFATRVQKFTQCRPKSVGARYPLYTRVYQLTMIFINETMNTKNNFWAVNLAKWPDCN